MTSALNRPGLGVVAYFAVMFSLGIYFMFASVQGDFGLFRRVQIEAELVTLSQERDRLAAEVKMLENKQIDSCVCGVHTLAQVQENFSASWTCLSDTARERLEVASHTPCGQEYAWLEEGWRYA